MNNINASPYKSCSDWTGRGRPHILAAAEDLDALRLVGQVLDVGALGEEAAVEHEERAGGLVHAGCCGA